ncbi:MAG: hypothetical protein J7K72_01475 [Candidatus Aenigmarchaeota archaeon]|nr:hypothetical protein [Candidatus Aenigmarchaeota archaeon]
MLKAEDTFNTFVGFVIFGFGIILLITILEGGLLNYKGAVLSDVNKLKAIEATHIVRHCFTNLADDNTISAYFLYVAAGKQVKELCNIKSPSIHAFVVDVENKREWLFDKKFEPSRNSHDIWVPISYDVDYIEDKKYNLKGSYILVVQKIAENWAGDDVLIEIYPKSMFEKDVSHIPSVAPRELKNYIKSKLELELNKFYVFVNFEKETPVNSFIPHGLAPINECGDSLSSVTCVVMHIAKTIHMGRLYVEVS